jgi:hypothetical protein
MSKQKIMDEISKRLSINGEEEWMVEERIPIAYQKIKWVQVEKGVYTVEITDIRKEVK